MSSKTNRAGMPARYDGADLVLGNAAISALRNWMHEFCIAMREAEPDDADCWTWGRCYIAPDMAGCDPLVFEYGGDADYPDDGLARFDVVPTERRAQGDS